MSAVVGFVSSRERLISSCWSLLRDTWIDYLERGWGWKLRSKSHESEIGIAVGKQGVESTFWEVSRQPAKDFDGRLQSKGFDSIQGSVGMVEVTRSSYDGYSAPVDSIELGACAVVGQITPFLEDIVGVERDSPNPWVGGGLAFIRWLATDSEQRLKTVAECSTHAIYLTICRNDLNGLLVVRSLGAAEDRQFVGECNGDLLFASTRYPLASCGAENIKTVLPGEMREFLVEK